MSYWNELLRNGEGVRYRGGRESISDWLLGALEGDLPYDRFVSKLLNPSGKTIPKAFSSVSIGEGRRPPAKSPCCRLFVLQDFWAPNMVPSPSWILERRRRQFGRPKGSGGGIVSTVAIRYYNRLVEGSLVLKHGSS